MRDNVLNERQELLNMLKVMWRKGDLPLRRIYPSWEELEANLDIIVQNERRKAATVFRSCPNCGVTQKIKKPFNDLFPYYNCQICKCSFYVNKDFSVRKLTEEEKEDMPAEWVRILEDLNKKKLAVEFRLE